MASPKSTKVECTCEVCKKSFFIRRSHFERNNPRFCSMACRRSISVEFHCEICGKSFHVSQSRADRGNVAFCSKQCQFQKTQINVGDRYNRLTCISLDRDRKDYYLFRCDCGKEKLVHKSEVKRGKTKSCGCLASENMSRISREHPKELQFDLTGQVFGRWTVLNRVPDTRHPEWFCRCECGNEGKVNSIELRHGNSKSCGCLNREIVRDRSITHGHTIGGRKSRTYIIWRSMINRCIYPNAINYKYYGGRGIKVCERWMKYENFLADLGEIRHPLSVDRIDNNGDYHPDNVKLSTPREQAQNKRKKSTHE